MLLAMLAGSPPYFHSGPTKGGLVPPTAPMPWHPWQLLLAYSAAPRPAPPAAGASATAAEHKPAKAARNAATDPRIHPPRSYFVGFLVSQRLDVKWPPSTAMTLPVMK